jgi:hypothetical protein
MTKKDMKQDTHGKKREGFSDEAADIIDSAADDEEPVRHLQGLKTIREALGLEDFPMSKEEVDYAVGDVDVEDGKGGFIPVYQLTERFKQNLFDTPEDVIHALQRARKAHLKSAA